MTSPSLVVNIGSSFEQTFVYTKADEPVDLTGWGAVFRLRDESDRVISTVRYGDTGDRSLSIDTSTGALVVTLVASATSGFVARTGTFELEIYELANTGRVFRIVDGATRYRQRGRSSLDNLVMVIRQTSQRVTVETQTISEYQRIDRGPPGAPGPQGATGSLDPTQASQLTSAYSYTSTRNPVTINANEPGVWGAGLKGDGTDETAEITALWNYAATLTGGCTISFKPGTYVGFTGNKRPQFCSIEAQPGATFFVRQASAGCGWVLIDESYVNIGQPWDSHLFGVTFWNKVTSDSSLAYCASWLPNHVYNASDVSAGLLVRHPDHFALCVLKLVQAGTSGAVPPIGEMDRTVKSPGVELRGIATANHGLAVRIATGGVIGAFTIDVSTNGGSTWDTNGGAHYAVTVGPSDNIKYGILWNVPSSFGLGTGLYVWFPCWNTGTYTAGTVIYPKPRVELIGTPTCAWQIHDLAGTVNGQLGTFAFKGGHTMASSATLVTIGNGAKTFTIATGLKIETDAATLPFFATSASGTVTGTVTSYTSSTGAIVANITSTTGSGSSSSWTVYWGAYERHKFGNTVVLEASAHTSGATTTTAAGTYWDYAIDSNLTWRFHAGYYNNPDATWDYQTPHGWSHAVGTRITDGTCIWEVQPVNGGFFSNVAGGCTVEQCGSIGGNVGVAINQSEGLTLRDGRWSAAGAVAWWFTNGGTLTPGGAGSFTNANSVEGEHIMSTEAVGIVHEGGQGFKLSGAITMQRCQLAWGHLAGLTGAEFKNKYQETSRVKIRDTAYFSRQSVGFSFKGISFRANNMVGATGAPASMDIYNGDGIELSGNFVTGTTAGVKLSGTTRGVRMDQTNIHNANGPLANTYAPVSQIFLADHMLDTIPRVHPPAIVNATNGANNDLGFFGESILLTGPSAAFSVTGLRPKKQDGTLLSAPYEGQEVWISWSANYPAVCTVTHNTGSTSGFRTMTRTGLPVTINPQRAVGMPWMLFRFLWPGTASAGWYLIDSSEQTVATVGQDDSDATLTVAGGTSYSWSTLTRNVAITLGTTSAYHDAEMELIRYSTSAFTITITDGGSSGSSKAMPVSAQAWQRWKWDQASTSWKLKAWASG